MLNIFLGRKPLPDYKLVQPSNGQLQEIIVKEDVRIPGDYVPIFIVLNCRLDYQDQTVCLGCDPTKYQIRPGSLRVLHCSSG